MANIRKWSATKKCQQVWEVEREGKTRRNSPRGTALILVAQFAVKVEWNNFLHLRKKYCKAICQHTMSRSCGGDACAPRFLIEVKKRVKDDDTWAYKSVVCFTGEVHEMPWTYSVYSNMPSACFSSCNSWRKPAFQWNRFRLGSMQPVLTAPSNFWNRYGSGRSEIVTSLQGLGLSGTCQNMEGSTAIGNVTWHLAFQLHLLPLHHYHLSAVEVT